MMIRTMKTCLVGIAVAAAVGLQAQETAEAGVGDLEVVEVNTLDELLRNVEERRVVESQEHLRREAEFQARKDQQAAMLADARAEKRAQERRSERLETTFEENEIRIGQMQEQYDKRLGSLRELFGVLQQVAGDTRAKFQDLLGQRPASEPGRLARPVRRQDGQGDAARDHQRDGGALVCAATGDDRVRPRHPASRAPSTCSTVGRSKPILVRVGAFAIVGAAGYINYDFNPLVPGRTRPPARGAVRGDRREPVRSGRRRARLVRRRPHARLADLAPHSEGNARRDGRHPRSAASPRASATCRSATARATIRAPSSSWSASSAC